MLRNRGAREPAELCLLCRTGKAQLWRPLTPPSPALGLRCEKETCALFCFAPTRCLRAVCPYRLHRRVSPRAEGEQLLESASRGTVLLPGRCHCLIRTCLWESLPSWVAVAQEVGSGACGLTTRREQLQAPTARTLLPPPGNRSSYEGAGNQKCPNLELHPQVAFSRRAAGQLSWPLASKLWLLTC